MKKLLCMFLAAGLLTAHALADDYVNVEPGENDLTKAQVKEFVVAFFAEKCGVEESVLREAQWTIQFGHSTLETAEDAVVREVQEELGVEAKIIRPLWLNQAFFTEVVSGEKYHELCLYYLMDVSQTPLLSWGERFERTEGKHHHSFEWLPFEQLQQEYLYPTFIKTAIFHLPEHLEVIRNFD